MPTRVHTRRITPVPREIISRWSEVPASVAADIFGGSTLVDPAIRPLRAFASGKRLVGPAVTALCTGTDYGPVPHAIAANTHNVGYLDAKRLRTGHIL